MDELTCDSCSVHLAWMINCGPRGWIECDSCHEETERKERESEGEENRE